MLGCSERKVGTCGRLPAFQRYDGPAYRVYRKFLREHPDAEPPANLYILSAKYGLISGDILIPDYDLRMTPGACGTVEACGQREVSTLVFSLHRYDEIFVAMGKVYRDVIDGFAARRTMPALLVAEGRIGEKSAALYRWLREGYEHSNV